MLKEKKSIPSLKDAPDGGQFDFNDWMWLCVIVRLEVQDDIGQDDSSWVHHQRRDLVASSLQTEGTG